MNNPDKLIIRALIYTALTTALIMTSFEIIKQLVNADITIWESHFVTIIFTTIVSVTVTYFVLNNHYLLLKVLSGFLPICANCKKIRDDKENWVPVEDYIREHTNAEFTHGICPDCGKKYLEEIKNHKTRHSCPE